VGGAQPAMASLVERFAPSGPILDLAGLGYQELGIDFVESAIAEAKAKAAALPEDVAARMSFQVADGLKPSALGRAFGAVIDSGFYHLLDRATGKGLAEQVASVLLPGGRYYLHEFAVEFSIPNVPRAVEEQKLREVFSEERGWRILAIEETTFLNTVAQPTPAICACVERMD